MSEHAVTLLSESAVLLDGAIFPALGARLESLDGEEFVAWDAPSENGARIGCFADAEGFSVWPAVGGYEQAAVVGGELRPLMISEIEEPSERVWASIFAPTIWHPASTGELAELIAWLGTRPVCGEPFWPRCRAEMADRCEVGP